jgi:predicted ferric reductase/Ca2+-binding EF-hand superfamily protein
MMSRGTALSGKEYTDMYNFLLKLVKKSGTKKGQDNLAQIKSKLNQYSEIKMEMKGEQLKDLLPNFNLDKPETVGFLSYLGIEEITPKAELQKTGEKESRKDQVVDVKTEKRPPRPKKNYMLEVEKFLMGLISSSLREISFDDKVEFIFSMYDLNKNGTVDKSEVEALLSNFNENNALQFDRPTLKAIVEILFDKIDADNSGVITKEEFKEFLMKHKDKPLTLNAFAKEKSFKAVIEGEKIGTVEKTTLSEKEFEAKEMGGFSAFLSLNMKSIIWLILYILSDMFWAGIFFYWYWNPEFPALAIAKLFAGLIQWNACLLLLFVCENFLTVIGQTFLHKILPMNDTKLYHQICASVFVFSGLGHALAHFCGTFIFVSSFTDVKILNIFLHQTLDSVPSYFHLVFQSIFGITGIIMILFIGAMAISGIGDLRRKNFECFWYIHKLYHSIFILIGLHGIGRVFAEQTYWKFIIGPAAVFFIELCLRGFRYFFNRTKILSAKTLDSGVIELILQRPRFWNHSAGQFASINIRDVSFIQYHPFTIASSQQQKDVIFYIAPAGWWTKSLETIGKKQNDIRTARIKERETMNENKDNKKPIEENEIILSEEREIKKKIAPIPLKKGASRSFQESHVSDVPTELYMDYPYCHIDGPYGAPATNYNDYNKLILIASGVGATPFASILFDFLHRLKYDNKMQPIQVDFYWVIRKYSACTWLINLFKEIIENDVEKKLSINLIFTGSNQKYDIRSFFLWHGLELLKKERKEEVSEYCGNIFWGRPDWTEMFKKKRMEYKDLPNNSNVGVFVCGNYELSKDVYIACQQYSGDGLTFDYHMENF